ncbi:MAG: hypothetical protein ACLFQT_03170 [Thiohalophilus sp.]
MAEATESLTLRPGKHDKLGLYHCGVTYEGFIVAGGEPHNIEDGEEITIQRAPLKVKREGSDYTFMRAA